MNQNYSDQALPGLTRLSRRILRANDRRNARKHRDPLAQQAMRYLPRSWFRKRGPGVESAALQSCRWAPSHLRAEMFTRGWIPLAWVFEGARR